MAQYPSVARIVHRDDEVWKKEVVGALLRDAVVGKKIDIELRERVRNEIVQTYTVSDFVDRKGDLKLNPAQSSDFVFASRRFTALAELFGMREMKERTHINAFRFLAAVYGEDHPEIKPHLDRLEKNEATQAALGTDPEKWAAFVKGEPVQVIVRAKREEEVAEHSIPTLKEYLELFQEDKHLKLEFAGRGWSYLAGNIFSFPAELTKRYQGVLFGYVMARTIYGPNEEIDKKIREIKERDAIQKELAQDPEKWRNYLMGKPLHLIIEEQEVDVFCPKPMPTYKDFLAVPQREKRKDLLPGIGLKGLAKEVFCTVDPRLKQASLDNTLDLYFLAAAIYGQDIPVLQEKIESLIQEAQAQEVLGTDLNAWSEFIQGKPVKGKTKDGVQGEWRAPRSFLDAEELLGLKAKARRGLLFAGAGLEKLYVMFIGRQGDPASDQADFEKLVYAIYYGRQGEPKPGTAAERLKQKVEQNDLYQALRTQFGVDPKKWVSAVQGEEQSAQIGGRKVTARVDEAFPSKEDFMAASGKRRNLKFFGWKIQRIARQLDIKDAGKIYSSRAVFQALADKLYG